MPMGIDPAPFWANIYLYNYDSKFIRGLVKGNNTQSHRQSVETICWADFGYIQGTIGSSQPGYKS